MAASDDPAHDATRRIPRLPRCGGRWPGPQTTTYCALWLELDILALVGRAVLPPRRQVVPGEVTKVRVIFSRHPPARLRPKGRAPARGRPARAPDRPAPGASRLAPQANSAGRGLGPADVQLEMDFASKGGEGPTARRGAPARGDGRRLEPLRAPGRGRGDVAGRQPLLDTPPPVEVVRTRLVGAGSADSLVDNVGG